MVVTGGDVLSAIISRVMLKDSVLCKSIKSLMTKVYFEPMIDNKMNPREILSYPKERLEIYLVQK